MDLATITEIADYYQKDMGYKIPSRTPFVGRLFNVTKAGIHADGLLKDQEIYNIFDTETILNRPPLVVIDSHSGLAGIAFWINSYFGLTGDLVVDKKEEMITEINEIIQKMYAEGRITSMSDEEMIGIIDRINPSKLRKFLKHKK
jgi:isopropylmalate/homocitrate/citramalate synthase